ncbi:ABC transporter permease subunit [Lacticaseibacillus kribbianus]|uniref:ABC transporter permease subunit n=1 Tax=Lacticaseibacillus kribbianus TaxID=2926292 RepID=UPI001CD495ED|nr:ABC transporter permease subunit [Lacticaseibacillus kribbianus]
MRTIRGLATQVSFDLKKNWRSATNVVMLIVFAALLLITFFTAQGGSDLSNRQTYQAYASADSIIQNQAWTLQKKSDKVKLTAAEQRRLDRKMAQHEYFKTILLAYSDVFSPIIHDQTTVKLASQKALLAYERYTLQETKAGRTDLAIIAVPGKQPDASLLGRKLDVAFYQYLVDHKLVEIPVTRKNAPANNYLSNVFLYRLSPLLLLAVFAVQAALLFTGEKRSGTINFMNNLPTGKFAILVARMASFVCLALPLFLIACVLTYGLVAHYNGVGSWQYPIVFSPDGRSVATMMPAQFLLLYTGLILAGAVFLMAVSALTSLFSGRLGVNLAVLGAVLATALPQVAGASVLHGVAPFLPGSYLQVSQVVLHQTAAPILSVGLGALVLLVWAGALSAVAAVVLHRRGRI